MFDPPRDNSAAVARQAEMERQSQIKTGRESIDKIFSQFGPEYYRSISDAYSDFYGDQLADQYRDARKATTFGLARSGNLNASAGARSLADLRESYLKNRALVGDRAIGAGRQAEADVANNRSELYAQLSASADPGAAATTAAARANYLTQPPQYSPIGDVFASWTNQGVNQIRGARAGFDNLASAAGVKPSKSSVFYV